MKTTAGENTKSTIKHNMKNTVGSTANKNAQVNSGTIKKNQGNKKNNSKKSSAARSSTQGSTAKAGAGLALPQFCWKNKKTKRLMIALSSLIGLMTCLVLVYCLCCKGLEDEKIWQNISVNGINIQNMTKEEAATALTQGFQNDYTNAAVTVTLEDQSYPMNIFSVLGFDASAVIDQAYQLGHGEWYQRGFDWLRKQKQKLTPTEITVKPYVAYPEKVMEIIANSGIQNFNNLVESSWEQVGDTLVIHKGEEGSVADVNLLNDSILASLSQQDYTAVIACPTNTTGIGDVDFQGIYNSIYKEPVSATLDKANGYAVTSSVNGVAFDVEQARQIYESTAYGADAVINLTVTQPTISTDTLSAKLFEKVLASYTTIADGGSSGRNTNIRLAAEACNGIILLPGETFSYNNTLGDTTEEKGYQKAGAYLDGEVVQELGGGICQVSSTIFAAVLYTNLEITRRRNHSMPVTYLPYGMDATVSIGSQDFRFTNNREYPVKLSVTYDGGALSVSIIGSDENDYSVDVEIKELEMDSSSQEGVETYRNFYDSNGNLVSTEYIGRSVYKV